MSGNAGGSPATAELYPLGENEFGRKNGMVKIAFGEGSLTIDGETVCKKL